MKVFIILKTKTNIVLKEMWAQEFNFKYSIFYTL